MWEGCVWGGDGGVSVCGWLSEYRRSGIVYMLILTIEALHVTYYTVNMVDCSSPFKRSVITTYHHSLSTVYQMHWYQIGQ